MLTLLRVALTIIGWLPLPLLHALGWLLGTLLVMLPNRFRAITRRHLERCLPALDDRARQRIARLSLIESAKAVLEAPAIWYGPGWRLRYWIDAPESAAILRAAQARGRGVILLTPHLGAWELASFFCGQVAPITVLYKPQKGAFDAAILGGRSRSPTVLPVPTTGGGVKALLSALKRGEMIGILPDHDPPEDSGAVFAPLFGIQAHTMELVARLAGRSGAPVLFIAAERRSWGCGFRFHLREATAAVSDPIAGPAALNQGVEDCVRAWPEQYWWSYQRYRRQPPGSADFYAGI